MRINKIILVSVILILLSHPHTSGKARAGENSNSSQSNIRVQIEEILNQVQRALITVQDTADQDKLPKLASVTLNLSTQFSMETGGKISLFIISAGAKVSKGVTQSITLKLEPPEPGTPGPAGAEEISHNLAEAILSAVRGAEFAKQRKPTLKLTELTASLKFVITAGISGGAKFVIMPVTIDMAGEVSEATTQEITVTFK